MKNKIGDVPFDELKKLLTGTFTTVKKIEDVSKPKPNSLEKETTLADLHEKNNGRMCGIHQVGEIFAGSVYKYKGTTIFVKLSKGDVKQLLNPIV